MEGSIESLLEMERKGNGAGYQRLAFTLNVTLSGGTAQQSVAPTVTTTPPWI